MRHSKDSQVDGSSDVSAVRLRASAFPPRWTPMPASRTESSTVRVLPNVDRYCRAAGRPSLRLARYCGSQQKRR